GGRFDQRPCRDEALVPPLRRPPHPLHPPVRGSGGLEPRVYRAGSAHGPSPRLLGPQLPARGGTDRTRHQAVIEWPGGAILLDVEGTTSAVAYVYDVMFP